MMGGVEILPLNEFGVNSIGVLSGVATLVLGGLSFYNAHLDEEEKKQAYLTELHQYLDNINEDVKIISNGEKELYKTRDEETALIDIAVKAATGDDGELLALDIGKVLKDAAELYKSGKVETFGEAIEFASTLRKMLYNGHMRTKEVDSTITEIATSEENYSEDTENLLFKYVNDDVYEDADDGGGVDFGELLAYTKNVKAKEMINEDFPNKQLPPYEVDEILKNNEIIISGPDAPYYYGTTTNDELAQRLPFEDGEGNATYVYKDIGGEENKNIYQDRYIFVRTGRGEGIRYYYYDKWFGKVYDLMEAERLKRNEKQAYRGAKSSPSEVGINPRNLGGTKQPEVPIGGSKSSPSEVGINPRNLAGTKQPEVPIGGSLSDIFLKNKAENNDDVREIGIFDIIGSIGDLASDLKERALGGLEPMTVEAATLPTPSSSGGGEEEKKSNHIGPVQPDYFANGKEVIESCSKSKADMRDIGLLEDLIDMFTEYLSEPHYKTINTMVGKDVDYEYVMKEIQRYIDEAYRIMPNVVEKTW